MNIERKMALRQAAQRSLLCGISERLGSAQLAAAIHRAFSLCVDCGERSAGDVFYNNRACTDLLSSGALCPRCVRSHFQETEPEVPALGGAIMAWSMAPTQRRRRASECAVISGTFAIDSRVDDARVLRTISFGDERNNSPPSPQALIDARRSVSALTRLVKADFSGMYVAMLDVCVRAAAASCPLLTHLDVSHIRDYDGVSSISDDALIAVAIGCPRLKHLYAADCGANISDASIVAVARGCPELETLVLDSISPLEVTSAALSELAARCLRLSHVIVDAPSQITAEGVVVFAHRSSRLRALCIGGEYLDNDTLLGFATGCGTTLRRLDIADSNITDVAIAAKYFLALEELVLRRCHHLNGDSIGELVKSMPGRHCRLTKLDVRLSSCTDAALAAVADNCPSLTYLDVVLTHVTGVGVSIVASGCLQLRDLYFSIRDTRTILPVVADACASLRRLRLESGLVPEEYAYESLSKVATRCSQLESVAARLPAEVLRRLKIEFPNMRWPTT